VFVTGTFDNWQKTVKLDKHASQFHKTVDLPEEKILYKVSEAPFFLSLIYTEQG